MNLEKLKQLLESGAITQEEYDALAKAVSPPEPQLETPKQEAPPKEESPEPAPPPTDTRQAEEIKQLRVQLDKLKKEKLTESERRALEMEEKERQLQEKEADLKNRENREQALRSLKKAGLDEPEDKDLVALDFIMGDSPQEIETKVKRFQEYLAARDKRMVNKIYGETGRAPQSGTGGGATTNPYAKETWNFTQQNDLELTSPQEAARFRAQAGIR